MSAVHPGTCPIRRLIVPLCAALVTSLALTAPQVALAQTGQQVGPTMCICPGARKPLGNNQTCEDACFGTRPSSGPSYSPPARDYEAERRAQEAEAEGERQRQAEADRVERQRIAEETRKKNAEFIRVRDLAAATLKGSIGTRAYSGDGGLKGSTSIDTGLRELRTGDSAVRDLHGPQAAWKQLHCAATLSGYAFAALAKPGPDFQEASFLAGQASKAMAGEKLGVECGTAPPIPGAGGKPVNWDRIRNVQLRMIERSAALSDRIMVGQQIESKYEPARPLTADNQRIQDAFRQQKENEARIAKGDAPVIAAQRAINRAQERKYDPKDAAAIRQAQQAKAEIDKYLDASKKLESGDPSAVLNLSVSLVDEPPRGAKRDAAAR